MCTVLDTLDKAVQAIPGLPAPSSLGAQDVLNEQVTGLASSIAVLQRELALRMAALEQLNVACDARGDAARAGLPASQAGRLRQLGVFAERHESLRQSWTAGTVTADHVAAVRDGASRLPLPRLRDALVELVLPHLPTLNARQARRLVATTVDHLDPSDPDSDDLTDHAARYLSWTGAGGGVSFQGYLPEAEGDAFTRAITALAEELRSEGDGPSPAQRRADALASLVARAGAHGLPTGGGLPASLTLTVSLGEAERIAQRDPAQHAQQPERRPRGGATLGDGRPASDSTVRFALCCGAVSPVLGQASDPSSPLSRIGASPVEPLAMGRRVRLATAAQRRALQLRDGGCAIPGCAVLVGYTQPHHVIPWAFDGPTDLNNLVSLCFVHHRQVELGRYRFQRRRSGDTQPSGSMEHPLWWITPPMPHLVKAPTSASAPAWSST